MQAFSCRFTAHISFHSQNDSKMRQMLFSAFHREKKEVLGEELTHSISQRKRTLLDSELEGANSWPGSRGPASFYFCSISSNTKLIGDTQGRPHCTGHKPQESQALRTRQGGFHRRFQDEQVSKQSGSTSRSKQSFSGRLFQITDSEHCRK